MSDSFETIGEGSRTSGAQGGSSTTDVAKDQAKAVTEQAKEGGQHLAEVGKDEAKNVTAEAGQQAKQLWQQTRSELLNQSAQQQDRVAQGLRSLSEELSSMATESGQQGVASDLATQASQRLGEVAGWLEGRDPGSLVAEVKRFARQRPGTFLAAAAAVGFLGGRLSRGLVAEHQDSSGPSRSGSAPSAVGSGSLSTGQALPAGYASYAPFEEEPVMTAGGIARGTGGLTADEQDVITPMGSATDPLAGDPVGADPLAGEPGHALGSPVRRDADERGRGVPR